MTLTSHRAVFRFLQRKGGHLCSLSGILASQTTESYAAAGSSACQQVRIAGGEVGTGAVTGTVQTLDGLMIGI